MENTRAEVIKTDIIHIWTRFNKNWAKAGVLAGFGAGGVMMLVAAALLGDFLAPARMIGAALLGPEAMAVGSFGGFAAGLAVHFGLSAFFGLVFAQFIMENSRRRSLLFLGVLGGVAVWLFWSMMFMPAFNKPLLFLMPKTVALFLHLLFGLTFGLLIVSFRRVFCR